MPRKRGPTTSRARESKATRGTPFGFGSNSERSHVRPKYPTQSFLDLYTHPPDDMSVVLEPTNDREWAFFNFWNEALIKDDQEDDAFWRAVFGEPRVSWLKRNAELAQRAVGTAELGEKALDAVVELVRRDPRYLATNWVVALVLEARWRVDESRRLFPKWDRTRPTGEATPSGPAAETRESERRTWSEWNKAIAEADEAVLKIAARFLYKLGQALAGEPRSTRGAAKSAKGGPRGNKPRVPRIERVRRDDDVKKYYDYQLRALKELKRLLQLAARSGKPATNPNARSMAARLRITEPAFNSFWPSWAVRKRGDVTEC